MEETIMMFMNAILKTTRLLFGLVLDIGSGIFKIRRNAKNKDITTWGMPSRGNLTARVIYKGSDIFLEPVVGNFNNIHHHIYKNGSTINILIRDQYDRNITAYVYTSGKWQERSLTATEKGRSLW